MCAYVGVWVLVCALHTVQQQACQHASPIIQWTWFNDHVATWDWLWTLITNLICTVLWTRQWKLAIAHYVLYSSDEYQKGSHTSYLDDTWQSMLQVCLMDKKYHIYNKILITNSKVRWKGLLSARYTRKMCSCCFEPRKIDSQDL